MLNLIRKTVALISIILLILNFIGCSNPTKQTSTSKSIPSITGEGGSTKTYNAQPASISSPSPSSKDRSVLNSGLLLALRNNKDENTDAFNEISTYRTLWIAPKDGSIEVIAEGADILVPYGADFWKICRKEIKEKNQSISYFTAYPAKDHEKLIIRGEQHPASLTSKYHIQFIGNKYACIHCFNFSQNENTSHGMGSREIVVREINKINQYDSDFENYTYTSAKDIFGNKITPIIENIANQKAPQGSFNNQEMDGHQWSITRSNGKWVPQLAKNIQYASRLMDYILEDIPFELPKSISVYDELTPDWNTIKKAVPDATDAVSSPSKDMLAVFTPGKLSIYVNPLNGITKSVLSIPIEKNESMIMDQWAVGDYVNKWTTEISKYLK